VGFSRSNKYLPSSDDRLNSPLNSVGRLPRFGPSPATQLNVGRENDPHRISFVTGDP